MLSAEDQLHRLSVDDVHRMVEAGVLGEKDRVELIDGVLVDMSPIGPTHSGAVGWLLDHFAGAVGSRNVRVQDVLLVEGGFFMPDLMVIDPVPRDQHPSTAALVVEVAVTSHRHDARKSRRYAAGGVLEHWIVDVPGRVVTVRCSPRSGEYRSLARYEDGERISTPVGAPEVDVSALLGPLPR